ncbi:MAG: glycosyltransferase [Cyanobacteria bacterium J06606_4]
MLSICDYLLSCWPQLSILLVSGSPMLQGFRLPKGLDYIKLPCLNRGVSGELCAKYLGTSFEDTIALRSQLIHAATSHFRPDLFIVDKKPMGLGKELLPTLNYLKRRLPNSRNILLLRDILDRPENTIREWQKWQYNLTIKTHYDQILVMGMQSVFDLAQEYHFPLPTARKLRYCGYIRKQPIEQQVTEQHSSQLRKSLNLGVHDRLALVTPGGGEDGFHLVDTYLRGLSHLALSELATSPPSFPLTSPPRAPSGASSGSQPATSLLNPTQPNDTEPPPKLHSLVLCGPEMPSTHQKVLQQIAKLTPRVTLQNFTDDLLAHVRAADVVVSMGGYNTLTEVLTVDKPAVVVPRVAPSQEQLIRANRFAQRSLLTTLHPNEITPRSLIENVLKACTTQHRSPEVSNRLDFNGLPNLANALLELVNQSPARSPLSMLA